MMSLVDCYLPVFRFITEFLLHSEKYSDYEAFRQTSIILLEQASKEAERNHGSDDCDNTLFAVVTWVDERVLCSSQDWVKQWRSAMLQTQLFQTSVGGEIFFNRLDDLEDNTPVKMVYLYCLLLGFHGKYTVQDNNELSKRIIREREMLPLQWQEWPSDTSIIPCPTHSDRRVVRVGNKFIRSGKGLSIAVLGCYALCFVGLMTYFS